MLLHPTYFPNIAHFASIVKAKNIIFEVYDNYQKQTLRNRTEIYGANGKLTLSVPVSYTQKQRQRSKDVLISGTDNWQALHLKSLQSAYRMSPFFEFYIDDLMVVFETKFKYLLDVNLKCFELLCDALEIESDYKLSKAFLISEDAKTDCRFLVNTKKNSEFNLKEYTQVFTQKHGFLANLSILDLLFNEGPNTINYLKIQNLNF